MNDIKPLISFDYAIRYLLKDKGDYSIVEGFISALLETQGYKPIKIIALLESESNREDPKNKRSLADVIVEDEDHNKYIIEIERNLQDSFIHKSCFNTSRLIVDHLAQGVDYTKILKVFHISLLYFPINNGVIYHGKTVIHEIHTQERLVYHIKNKETQETLDATDILPEYFYISIPAFNDQLVKEIDEWLYVMKHDAIPEGFHSPYMRQVQEKLNVLKMTPAQRVEYAAYRKHLIDDNEQLSAAINRGREEGREEGRHDQAIMTARTLLKLGLSIDHISQATGLSAEAINTIIAEDLKSTPTE